MPDSRLLPLPRRPSLSPVEWTLGHVAFTFEMMYARRLLSRCACTCLGTATQYMAAHCPILNPASMPLLCATWYE
jgi:hypothetical protein